MPLLLIKLKDWEGTFLSRGAAQREPQQQKGTGATETQTFSLTNTGWSSGPATGQPAPPGKPTEDNVDYSLGAQAAQGSARLLPLSLKPGKVKHNPMQIQPCENIFDWLPRSVILLFQKSSEKDNKLKGLIKEQELIKSRAGPSG